MTTSGTRSEDREGDIQVITRCVDILHQFADAEGTLSTQEVVNGTGMQRTTVYRYLTSMAASGMLTRHADGRFGLGELMLHIGRAAIIDENVVTVSESYMMTLRDEVSETVDLSVWGGHAPVVVRVHVHRRRPAHVSLTVGSSLAVTTSQSQIFLAFSKDRAHTTQLLEQLPGPARDDLVKRIREVRRTGLATNASVAEASGISALAAGIFGRYGDPLAALALVGTLPSIQTDLGSHHAQALLATARAISNHLGYDREYPPQVDDALPHV